MITRQEKVRDGVILTYTAPQRQTVDHNNNNIFVFFRAKPETSVAKETVTLLQNSPIILQDNARAHVVHPVADL